MESYSDCSNCHDLQLDSGAGFLIENLFFNRPKKPWTKTRSSSENRSSRSGQTGWLRVTNEEPKVNLKSGKTNDKNLRTNADKTQFFRLVYAWNINQLCAVE